MKFNELNINKKTLTALIDMNFENMTPIQEKTIPKILNNYNIIGEAHTGTGKTAAFGIPLFEKIDEKINEIQVLIMAPTRELAMQIVQELKKIGKNYNYNITAIVGGMSISEQAKELKKKSKIIVATPGRLIDHLEKNRLTLNNIKIFVLDEVDEMLKIGFKEEIDKIIKLLPNSKQTLLFSATVSKSVKDIAKKIDNNFELISVNDGTQSTNNISQYYIITKEEEKFNTLINLLNIENPKLSIIFGRTKRRADELNEALSKNGYKVSALHGDLSQSQRNNVLRKFKNNEIDILTATDVAARGLDISGVSHVFNFDLPQEVEYYIHRIGRTGRANNTGKSYTFVRDVELEHLEKIKKNTNSIINILKEPSNQEINDLKEKLIITKINDILLNSNINNTKQIEFILNTYSKEDLASIIFNTFFTTTNTQKIKLTKEPPVKIKFQKNTNFNIKNKYNKHIKYKRKSHNFKDKKRPY